MKISLVIANGTKQIMMTPETDFEREALKFIEPNSTLHTMAKWGTYDDTPSHYSMQTYKCEGGYLRRFAEKDSLMFVIEEKKETSEQPA